MPKRRWMRSLLRASKDITPPMPWQRGARRALAIPLRKRALLGPRAANA